MKYRVNGRNIGAYSFQNSFFYLQFPDDPTVFSQDNSIDPAVRAALITQRKTKRLENQKNPNFPFFQNENFVVF